MCEEQTYLLHQEILQAARDANQAMSKPALDVLLSGQKPKPMKEWQDLTDEELHEVAKDYEPFSVGEWNMMRLVEKALREKNVRD